MMVDMPPWISHLAQNAPTVLIPAGAAIALVVLVLIARSLRRSKPDTIAVNTAVLLASAFSAQGMYEVATTRLHLPWYLAAVLFAVAEMAMLASAVRAHRHYEATATAEEQGTLGPHQRFVWTIAIGAGVIVSLNAHSPSEYFLRLLMPLLVAGLWRMGYVSPTAKRKARDAITMRWTWRRIAEKWGIVEPGEKSLAIVSAERQVRSMTAHAHALHRGSILRTWHAARLRKLGLAASDAVIAAVQESVSRVHYIEDSTAPSLRAEHSAVLPARWWLSPWRSAKRSALAAQALRTAQEAATHAVEQAQAAQRSVEGNILRLAEEHRAALAEQAAATRTAVAQALTEQHILHTAQLDELRAQHARDLAAQRRTVPPRSTPQPARTAQEHERTASNAARLTDEDAVAVLLRTHDSANYQWRPQEVTDLTGAAFRRAEKLLRMVAEHHERQARNDAGDDESERELAAIRPASAG